MRYFVAIPLSEEVKQEIHEIRRSFQDFKGVNFVNPENMHLTLFFLGERKNIGETIEAMRKVKFSKFTLETAGNCVFPDEKKPRVACLKVKNSQELADLYENLNIIFNEKREYKPHLTFARIKFLERKRREEFMLRIKERAPKKMFFEVAQFKLYSSELTPLGPIHRVAEYFPSE